MHPHVSGPASSRRAFLPARLPTLSLMLLCGLALALAATGCRRTLQPVGPPPGSGTPAVVKGQEGQTLVALWERTLRADPSRRGTPSLQELSWDVVRAGMEIEAPAIILTGRGGRLRLTTPATAFQESFLAMVREGGTLGYRMQGDLVALEISGGMYYTLTHRRDAHTTSSRVVGRVAEVEGLAVVSVDHHRITSDFSGAVQHSLGATVPVGVPAIKGRKGLGIAGKSVTDLEPHDVVVSMMGKRKGIRVDAVFPGSPAARAGMEVGDVLVRFAGTAVDGWRTLKRSLDAAPVGKPVEVTVFRPGKGAEVRLKVTLGEFAVAPALSPFPASPRSEASGTPAGPVMPSSPGAPAPSRAAPASGASPPVAPAP